MIKEKQEVKDNNKKQKEVHLTIRPFEGLKMINGKILRIQKKGG